MIFDLIPIPKFKLFEDKFTQEQYAIDKCINNQTVTSDEENILKDAIRFYKDVFPRLKKIDLSIITDDQVQELKQYLDQIFNFNIIIQNDIDFKFIFRVSFVNDKFIEKGKVRNPKFLTHPSLEIVKEKGVYNRANTCEKTVFYGSFYENVAIRETKPKVGDKIIISTWKNITGKSFNSYPIANSTIKNIGANKANDALKRMTESKHPLFKELINLNIDFLSSEFVKDGIIKSPKRYEYLYSAYFADKILDPFIETDTITNYDFIIYPSVAWKHKHENVAIIPDSVKNKLKLIKAVEYEVLETFYDKELEIDEMPVKLKFIREAKDWIYEDLIIWEDE